MRRMVAVGILVALAAAGCSSEPDAESAPTTTMAVSSSTSAPITTPAPVLSSTETAPSPPPAAAEPAPEPPPTANVDDQPLAPNPDRPSGEELYTETCQRFLAAMNGVAATGALPREQAASGIAKQLQANPSWSTIPPEDQQQMLRGLDAAGRGSC